MCESLRPIAAGLSALYLVFAVSHRLVLQESVTTLMSLVAAASAALLLSLYVMLGRWSIPNRWAHPIVASMAGLVLLNSFLHLYLLSEPQQTTNFMLLVIGVGCLFLSTGWLALALAATIGVWGVVVWGAAPSPLWIHFGFGLLSASVLSVLIYTVRVRAFRRLERLRVQNEYHKRGLEEAVHVAQRSEQRYRAVVEEQTELICRFLPDTILTFVNSAYCRYFGRRSEELLGQSFLSLVPEVERQAAAAHIASLLENPRIVLHEHAVIAGGGELRWQQWTDRAILDDHGHVIEFQSVGRDITERKRADETLRRSEEYFRALTENALDIITILNGDGTVRHVSPSAGRTLGYTLQDSLGKEGFGFVHPDDLPGIMNAFVEAIQKPGVALYRSEFRLRHKDGSWRIFECIGKNLLDNPAVEGLVVNARDITERRQAEEALRHAYEELEKRVEARTAELAEANAQLRQEVTERQRAAETLRRSEEHFRLLIENALDIIILLNSDGTVRYQSPSAERVLGHKQEEAVDRSGFEFIHPDDLPHVIDVFTDIIQKPGILPPIEMRVRHKDGSWHVIETLGNNLLNNPAVEGIIINVRDITERKQMEGELLKAKEMAEAANYTKSEFLATMSHELRTPLNVILGYADLLLEETFGSLSEEQARPLRRINSNARELLDLITAVLDMSRLEAGRLPMEVQEVELLALLEEIKAETQGVQEQSDLDFVWKVEDELPPLYTDPGKLKVVLKNLIGNAVKFTKEGCITVEAQGCLGGVEIKVIDTGIGIPPEALGLIFEPFRQADSSMTRLHEGTGLGLHIVKRLLELLGGTVAVESEVGRGSTFRVWVPRECPAFPDVSSDAAL
jgi:PAS domain S-box-containing protein